MLFKCLKKPLLFPLLISERVTSNCHRVTVRNVDGFVLLLHSFWVQTFWHHWLGCGRAGSVFECVKRHFSFIVCYFLSSLHWPFLFCSIRGNDYQKVQLFGVKQGCAALVTHFLDNCRGNAAHEKWCLFICTRQIQLG